jgi:hypothetical protein
MPLNGSAGTATNDPSCSAQRVAVKVRPTHAIDIGVDHATIRIFYLPIAHGISGRNSGDLAAHRDRRFRPTRRRLATSLFGVPMMNNKHSETAAFDPLSSVSDSTDKGFCRTSAAVVTDVFQHGVGEDGRSSAGVACWESSYAGRSPLWRTAIHEASHICAARFQNLDVAGSTLVEGPDYQGMTWSSGSKRALRGKVVYDSDGSDAHDAVAVRVADNISKFMTGAGEDAVADIFSSVKSQIIDLMAGAAGEMIFLGDAPPLYMTSDVLSANALAGIICRSPASRASFIEHCYQEALVIIESNKPVVIALATALIDHPELTLDGAEIDQCIADTINLEARQIEAERRAKWAKVMENATDFVAGLES